jgi:hypothetical protein
MFGFNPHGNVTADGVLITEGLRVWTNEMKRGIVHTDDNVGEHLCCSDNKNFDEAVHHPKGQMKVNGGWFTDHTVTCEDGFYCGHDHWFQVSTADGTKSFNGERLATVFEGRKA